MGTDLSSLFSSAPQGMGNSNSVVIGLLTSFDPTTGANTVVVNGAALSNLPILITGAEVGLIPGATVWLMVINNTYAIMGQVAPVGSSAFGRESVATADAFAQASGFTMTTTPQNLVATSINVPSWANHAQITMIGSMQIVSNSSVGTAGNFVIDVYNDGTYHPGQRSQFLYGSGAASTVTVAMTLSRAVTPGGSLGFTVQGNWSTTSVPSIPSAWVDLSASAVFTKS